MQGIIIIKTKELQGNRAILLHNSVYQSLINIAQKIY